MSEEKKDQFIGKKKIISTKVMEEKTPGGYNIIEVVFDDFSIEHFSQIMFDKVVSDETCDDTALRDKRVFPVVETLLSVLREWGIKTGETPYISALLNQSLNKNTDEALYELLSQWMPRPKSLDEIDLLCVDRILKSHKQTVSEVLDKKT